MSWHRWKFAIFEKIPLSKATDTATEFRELLRRNLNLSTALPRAGGRMKTLTTFFLFLLALSAAPLHAQSLSSGLSAEMSGSAGMVTAATTAAAMAQDTTVKPCQANASGSYVSALSCSLGAVPAADTIICSAEAGDSGPAVQVKDNINGVYDMDVYGVNNSGYHEYLMVWSFANTAAGATTVTMSFSITIDATGFSCAAFKGGRTTDVIDHTFFGWNDGTKGASNSSTLTTSKAPANAGELIYCAMSAGTPSDSVKTASSSYEVLNPSSVNSIFPLVSAQTTATAADCPYDVTPADYTTNTGVAFLAAANPAGIRPYQGMILTFGKLVNGTAPTTTQLSQSVSGGVPGWFGPELDWWYNPFWRVANTYSDVTASTAGPTAGLSSTLYLPAQQFETANSISYTAYTAYTGNSPLNLQMTTGHYGDGLWWNVMPTTKQLSFGYYLEWSIPNNDTDTHSYGLGGAMTGKASSLTLRLVPTGSTMDVDMVGGASQSVVKMGTGSASTTYWVTGSWTTAGTLEMSYYTGCPSACTRVGSGTISDPSNPYPVDAFLLGLASGTQASGDHIWWRNFKMCPNETYPCLP